MTWIKIDDSFPDHPKLGTGAIRTSVVIKKDDNGFETLNTVYERAIKDE